MHGRLVSDSSARGSYLFCSFCVRSIDASQSSCAGSSGVDSCPAHSHSRRSQLDRGVQVMIILGLILLILGLVLGFTVLFWIGAILLVVGLVLNFVPVGGSRHRLY